MEIKLQEIVRRICRIPFDDEKYNELFARQDLDFIDDMGFDSFLMVQLIVELEEELEVEFDIEILDMEEVRKFKKLVGSMAVMM